MAMRRWQVAGAVGVLLAGLGGYYAVTRPETGAPPATKPGTAPFIYRGEAVSSTVFTWQVGIAIGPGGRCGGVVVSRNHVLSAAHCLDRAGQAQFTQPLPPGQAAQPHDLATIRILHGSDTWETDRPIAAQVVFHPFWRAKAHAAKHDFDAAIITLSEPLDTDGVAVRSAALDAGTDRGWVSGWGTNLQLGMSGSESLRAAPVRLIGNAACDNDQTRPKLTANKLCAGDPDRATCAGDSGGPLVVGELGRVQLIGIVHAGARSCGIPVGSAGLAQHISIFMRSAALADWIATATGGQARLTTAAPGPLFAIPKTGEI